MHPQGVVCGIPLCLASVLVEPGLVLFLCVKDVSGGVLVANFVLIQ